MRGALIGVCCLFLLSGCGVTRQPAATVSYYDLGGAIGDGDPGAASLRSLHVTAPSWLDSSGLQYRLLYSDDKQRRSYSQSRLVASPRELVEFALRGRLLGGERQGDSGGCQLNVELEEFAHLFDSPAASRGVLKARAQLSTYGSPAVIERSFSFSEPAPSPDARGGIAALSACVRDLSSALRSWLAGLDPNATGDLNGIKECGNK